jgi:diguanylate cyclase (GGDEF)-like protein
LGLSCGADDYLTKPFSPAELRARLKVGCRLIGFQREMREKNRQLEELAYTDPLTGLPNRRAIEVWAQSQIAAAIRHKFPLCVAMADLDRFKRLNDTFGHGSGDTVLRRFAKILKENCRSSSLYGRVGGEEFLIVMTHTNLAGAAVAIEHIRERFAEQVFSFGAHDVVATASFGVACHSGGSQTFRELVSRADAALYSAKQSGRNRIGFD